jgi:hypothetical protein
MRPQFPGMDPWLEHPDLWSDVHNSLIVAIRDVLSPMLVPRYAVRVESRMTVLSGPEVDRVYEPDVAVRKVSGHLLVLASGNTLQERSEVQTYEVSVPIEDIEIEETFLTIKDLPGRNLITVIEALSPTNKKVPRARLQYLKKRRDLIRSRVNFIEIDLLRGGKPMPLFEAPPPNDYRILICRARPRRKEIVCVFPWTAPIPAIPIPILPNDPEPVIDLNSLLQSLMDRARYDVDIDYSRPPRPRFWRADAAWAAPILARAMNESDEPPANGETTP